MSVSITVIEIHTSPYMGINGSSELTLPIALVLHQIERPQSVSHPLENNHITKDHIYCRAQHHRTHVGPAHRCADAGNTRTMAVTHNDAAAAHICDTARWRRRRCFSFLHLPQGPPRRWALALKCQLVPLLIRHWGVLHLGHPSEWYHCDAILWCQSDCDIILTVMSFCEGQTDKQETLLHLIHYYTSYSGHCPLVPASGLWLPAGGHQPLSMALYRDCALHSPIHSHIHTSMAEKTMQSTNLQGLFPEPGIKLETLRGPSLFKDRPLSHCHPKQPPTTGTSRQRPLVPGHHRLLSTSHWPLATGYRSLVLSHRQLVMATGTAKHSGAAI